MCCCGVKVFWSDLSPCLFRVNGIGVRLTTKVPFSELFLILLCWPYPCSLDYKSTVSLGPGYFTFYPVVISVLCRYSKSTINASEDLVVLLATQKYRLGFSSFGCQSSQLLSGAAPSLMPTLTLQREYLVVRIFLQCER